MALKLVVDADMVRQRMSLSDLPDINEAIDSALIAAHLHFQGVFRTEFAPQFGLEDVFYTDSSYFPQAINGYLRLRLSRAFVDPNSLQLIAGDSPHVFTEAITADSFKIDSQKGVVFLSSVYEDKYIKVTYGAGFSGDVKAPEWLKEAILSFVPSVLNNQQTTNRSEEAEPVARQARNLTEKIFEEHLRRVPFCYKPLFNA